MIRHIVAGVLLCLGAVAVGAARVGGVAAYGGCPPACEGTISLATIEPPLDCVALHPLITTNCECQLVLHIANGCETDVVVAAGAPESRSCNSNPSDSGCVSIAHGETMRREKEFVSNQTQQAEFSLWNAGMPHRVTIEATTTPIGCAIGPSGSAAHGSKWVLLVVAGLIGLVLRRDKGDALFKKVLQAISGSRRLDDCLGIRMRRSFELRTVRERGRKIGSVVGAEANMLREQPRGKHQGSAR